MDGEGNILVADSNNNRIQKLTSKGQFLTSVGTEGNEHHYPSGLTVNAANDKVHDLNHRVQVLNSDLTFSTSFGKEGRWVRDSLNHLKI